MYFVSIFVFMYICWRCPNRRKEGPGEGSGLKVLRVAERAGVAYTGEEEAQGRSRRSLKLPERRL